MSMTTASTPSTPGPLPQGPGPLPLGPLPPGRRAVLVIGGVLAAALVVFGTWSLVNLLGQTTTERTTTLVPTSDRLTIRADGDIRVEAGTGPEVRVVERVRHGIGRPEVDQRPTSDGLLIDSDCPWYSTNCSVDLIVTVPATLSVDAHSSAGDITAIGVSSDLTLTSSAGDVRASGLRTSRVDASSSAGDVTLSFDAPPVDVVAGSSAGDVDIRLPRVDGGYRVSVDTSAGDQHVEVPTDPESSRRIDAGSSAGDVTVRTNE